MAWLQGIISLRWLSHYDNVNLSLSHIILASVDKILSPLRCLGPFLPHTMRESLCILMIEPGVLQCCNAPWQPVGAEVWNYKLYLVCRSCFVLEVFTDWIKRCSKILGFFISDTNTNIYASMGCNFSKDVCKFCVINNNKKTSWSYTTAIGSLSEHKNWCCQFSCVSEMPEIKTF